MEWYQLKLALSEALGVSQDALHVLAGVAVLIAAAIAVRRPLGHPLPWLIVVILTALNEFSDLRLEIWPNRSDQWTETVKDVMTTLALPTSLALLARWVPGLFVRPSRNP